MSSQDRQPPQGALHTLARALAEAARSRDEIRQAVHEVALWLAAETAPAAERVKEAPARPQPVIAPPAPPLKPAPPVELVERELRVGDVRVSMHVPAAPNGVILPDDLNASITGPTVVAEIPAKRRGELSTIARRARLKAEAGRWAAARTDALAQRTLGLADLQQRDELIRRAKAMDGCWLWMLDPSMPAVAAEVLLLAAENYETLALAAELAEQWLLRQPTEELMYLVAEAQSALRAVLLEVGIDNDADQMDLFWWLRDIGQSASIYIGRHMRKDDPADPAQATDLGERLQAWASRHEDRRRNDRVREQLLRKVQYHAKRLLGAEGDDAAPDWQKVLESLEEWTSQGFYPSDANLCRALLPVYERMPEELDPGEGARLVLRCVDTLAAQQERASPEDLEPRPRSREVEQAAQLLRGRTVVLIGGDVRPLQKRRLERDLELAELRWLSTRPHERLDSLIPDIIRPDIDVVMLAIRLTSHSHGDLAEVCERAGKPFVRLPGGYGSAQVAHQVLEQASHRLTPAIAG